MQRLHATLWNSAGYGVTSVKMGNVEDVERKNPADSDFANCWSWELRWGRLWLLLGAQRPEHWMLLVARGFGSPKCLC